MNKNSYDVVLQQDVDNFADCFFRATHMHIGIHNIDRTRVASAGDECGNLCSVCREISSKFYDKCVKNDVARISEVQRSRQTVLYRCHIGLLEAIIPVVEDGKVLGLVFIGQAIDKHEPKEYFDEVWSQLSAIDGESFRPETKVVVRQAFLNTAHYTMDEFKALTELCAHAARWVYVKRFLSEPPQTTAQLFQRYLQNTDLISEPLGSLRALELAERLNISYSQLNRLSRQITGMTYKKYILSRKMSAARDLVEQSSLPIGVIAESVGISDVHYFSRLFREFNGKSCTEIRSDMPCD